MARKQPTHWTVSTHKSEEFGYAALVLTFARCERRSVSADMADAVEYGRDDDSIEYHRNQARAIREATGGTRYYRRSHSDQFSVKFQANLTPVSDFDGSENLRHWYGAELCGGGFSADIARAISKLAKLSYDAQPVDFVKTLRAHGIEYLSGAGIYVPADIEGDLVSPLAARAAEQEENARGMAAAVILDAEEDAA
jgi:hypothetical protein